MCRNISSFSNRCVDLEKKIAAKRVSCMNEILQEGFVRWSASCLEIKFDIWSTAVFCCLKILVEGIAWVTLEWSRE